MWSSQEMSFWNQNTSLLHNSVSSNKINFYPNLPRKLIWSGIFTFKNSRIFGHFCYTFWNNQSIVGTELFPFNSRSVHVHERNFGHFFKGNSVMNMNGTLVTFSQWTECKSLFIFSVRAEHIFAKKAFETFLSKHIFHFFLKKSFGFNCCWIIKQINFRWITKWHHP